LTKSARGTAAFPWACLSDYASAEPATGFDRVDAAVGRRGKTRGGFDERERLLWLPGSGDVVRARSRACLSAGDSIVGAGILFHQEGARLGCDVFAGDKRVTGCFEGFLPFEELVGDGPVKEIVVQGCRTASKQSKQSKPSPQSTPSVQSKQNTPGPVTTPSKQSTPGTVGTQTTTSKDGRDVKATQESKGAKDGKDSAQKTARGPCGDPLKITLRGFELVEVRVTGGTDPGSKPALTIQRQRDIRP
jgi:hypothetical protein